MTAAKATALVKPPVEFSIAVQMAGRGLGSLRALADCTHIGRHAVNKIAAGEPISKILLFTAACQFDAYAQWNGVAGSAQVAAVERVLAAQRGADTDFNKGVRNAIRAAAQAVYHSTLDGPGTLSEQMGITVRAGRVENIGTKHAMRMTPTQARAELANRARRDRAQ